MLPGSGKLRDAISSRHFVALLAEVASQGYAFKYTARTIARHVTAVSCYWAKIFTRANEHTPLMNC